MFARPAVDIRLIASIAKPVLGYISTESNGNQDINKHVMNINIDVCITYMGMFLKMIVVLCGYTGKHYEVSQGVGASKKCP